MGAPITAMGECFQDAMPGDVCFGCGADNTHGLRIRSFWEGDEGVCHFTPMPHHQGWPGITCGGILATLVDCHCMATAMASAVRREGRALDSEPHYRFATGSMSLRYLKPTPNDRPLVVRAHVTEVKDDRKYTLACAASTRRPRPRSSRSGSIAATGLWRPASVLRRRKPRTSAYR